MRANIRKLVARLDAAFPLPEAGGIALLTSVMYFPIHEHPADYWRFTPDGMRAFARPFTRLTAWRRRSSPT